MSSTVSDAALQSHRPSGALARHARAWRGAILRLVKALARAADAGISHRQQLRELADLDDHLLRDVGLSREDVARACGRSIWND